MNSIELMINARRAIDQSIVNTYLKKPAEGGKKVHRLDCNCGDISDHTFEIISMQEALDEEYEFCYNCMSGLNRPQLKLAMTGARL